MGHRILMKEIAEFCPVPQTVMNEDVKLKIKTNNQTFFEARQQLISMNTSLKCAHFLRSFQSMGSRSRSPGAKFQ
jgi:hypothetical protein